MWQKINHKPAKCKKLLDWHFMNKSMEKQTLTRLLVLMVYMWVATSKLYAQSSSKNVISSSKADTWVAKDALGRSLTANPRLKKDKYVGIFYFEWQGAHGYDHAGEGKREDEGLVQKSGTEKDSPYDISKMLQQNTET